MLDDETFKCKNCNRQSEKTELDRNYQYFLHIPITNQLIDFIHSPLYASISPAKGIFHRRLLKTGVMSSGDLSLQVNTDGVSPLKSSNRSIWPIQVMINELPYTLRKKNIFLCGVWYNEHKPPMNLYFSLFVDEIAKLAEFGIQRNVLGEEETIVKVRVTLFTVDSVARLLLQQIHQFNGQFGCTFCLRPGVVVPVGEGHTRVYPTGAAYMPR